MPHLLHGYKKAIPLYGKTWIAPGACSIVKTFIKLISADASVDKVWLGEYME